MDAHFLYQPTADDEAVLANFRKKWSFATRRATRRRLWQLISFNYLIIYEVIRYIISYWLITRLKFSRPNGVESNEVAISTETYEITSRAVSSLLGDQAQDESSKWISTVIITYSFCILDPFFIAYLRHKFYNSTLFTKQV